MTNVFTQAITDADGKMNFEKMRGLVPDKIDDTRVISFVMGMLGNTKLDPEFIATNFKDLNLTKIIQLNTVPQQIIEDNIESVYYSLLHTLIFETDDNEVYALFADLVNQDYDGAIYEVLLDKLINTVYNKELSMNFDQDLYRENPELKNILEDVVLMFINDKLSKEFILAHNNKAGLSYVTAFFTRDDFTEEELIENINLVHLEELTAMYDKFDDIGTFEDITEEEEIENEKNLAVTLRLIIKKSEWLLSV